MEGTRCEEAGNGTCLRLMGVALPGYVVGHCVHDLDEGVARPVVDPGDELLDLAVNKVGQLDTAPGIRQGSFQLLNRYLLGDRSGCEPVKRIQPTNQTYEQVIGCLPGKLAAPC